MDLREKIVIMISSRCKTLIKKQDGSACELSILRKELENAILQGTLFGNPIFQVRISEEPGATAALTDIWDTCRKWVRECHLLIFLYTKEAGWAARGDIGICHVELETAINLEPGKVFIIDISEARAGTPKFDKAEKRRNELLVNYVDKIRKIHGQASSYEDILEMTQNVIAEAVVRFVHLGKRECGRGKYSAGPPLDWSRLNYLERKHQIEATMVDHLVNSEGAEVQKGGPAGYPDLVTMQLGGENIALICHGIPAGMGVAAAREMVGQPFLQDHVYLQNQNPDFQGPIHLIGVHKGVTESQAIKQLGFPDAIVVNAPFGVYVADKVTKIQMVFLANCRDDTTTRANVQRFLDWIDETGENDFIRKRSISRRKIVNLIQAEID